MNPPHYFTLDSDRTVRATTDVSGWLDWMIDHNDELSVAQTLFSHCQVHTAFLGSDLEEPDAQDGPLPFETVIVGGPHDGKNVGAATWEKAHANHTRICEALAKEACDYLSTSGPSPFLE